MQYTSGSTSTPKGVRISHENIFNHLRSIQLSCGYTPNSVTVTWMPHFHDYGLVEGIMLPLFNGTPCYLMSPFAFAKRPSCWLQAISDYKATHSQAPNFAYEQCIKRVSPEYQKSLDLSSWISAANAAEPINPRVMIEFYEKFKHNYFHWNSFSPAYGLAENTLVVSINSVFSPPVLGRFNSEALGQSKVIECIGESESGTIIVGCGEPIHSTEVVIVDPVTKKRCATDAIGEVWVTSSGVANGFWRRAEESTTTFQAKLVDGLNEDKTYLRTGDLGFMKEGELFITGRLKDLIIIDGVNHWPHDIEWTVEQSHPAIRSGNCCAAFSINELNKEKLIVVIETEKSRTNFKDIYQSVKVAISEYHDIKLHQLVVVSRGGVFKTSSGKVQRNTCRSSFSNGSLPVLWSSPLNQGINKTALESSFNPDNKIKSEEQVKLETWLIQEIFKLIGTSSAEIEPETPLSALGLGSMDTLILVCEIEDKIGKKIPLAEVIGDGVTIHKLVKKITESGWSPSKNSLVAIQPKGSKPPLFCIHPAGGNVVGYSALAKHLGTDQPLYGLQSQGLIPGQRPLTSFEDMAKHYLKEIKELQPEGPYYLSGMCLGGMIAFEMAQQLKAEKSEVAFLGLIDPRNPPTLLNKIISQNSDKNYANEAIPFERRELLCKLRDEAKVKPPISFPDNLVPEDPTLKKVMDTNGKARDIYLPRTYTGLVEFFWANQTPGDLGFYHDPRVCWSQLAGGGLNIHEIDANHFELLEEPHVKVLAEKIKRCLEQINH
ncbi:AMP-dependent synthetase and ligase [Oceanimonas sp. GK1]|nr:AMP-dependent synthetase and ligase [Oceanimonas sp. GK1]